MHKNIYTVKDCNKKAQQVSFDIMIAVKTISLLGYISIHLLISLHICIYSKYKESRQQKKKKVSFSHNQSRHRKGFQNNFISGKTLPQSRNAQQTLAQTSCKNGWMVEFTATTSPTNEAIAQYQPGRSAHLGALISLLNQFISSPCFSSTH